MLMLLPLLGVGGGLSVWARGAGCGPAAWCSECWQWGRVLKYVSSSIPDSEGWPLEPGPAPTPPPTPRTPAPRWASAVTRRGGGSRKEENVLSCGIWCNEANLPHNHQEAEAGGWYFSAMPLKPHCGGCSGHLLPLLLMRPLNREECSVFT